MRTRFSTASRSQVPKKKNLGLNRATADAPGEGEKKQPENARRNTNKYLFIRTIDKYR
jgi:hypothetical protein